MRLFATIIRKCTLGQRTVDPEVFVCDFIRAQYAENHNQPMSYLSFLVNFSG